MNNMKGVTIMYRMKKYLSLLLVLTLVLTCAPLSALAESGVGESDLLETEEALDLTLEESEPADGEADVSDESQETAEGEAEEEENVIYPDELLVGHPTVMKGDFFTEMIGNDTVDIDVRALIHGYNLVNWNQNQGTYVIDPSVVKEVRVTDDAQGNRTYLMMLWDDLKYSDGTDITAWDYAFSLLLMMAPEIEEIGGKIYRAEHILGYDEYITKKTYALSGVDVLSDHQIAITLDHEFLPYFFEVGLLLCVPYPISVIAPGCKVYYDKGVGIYIGNEDQSIEEPIFTAELLKKTILDPESGYNSHPSVVSGPYVLLDFKPDDNDDETDGNKAIAHFEINPYFKGAWVNNSLPLDFHFNMQDFQGVGAGRQRDYSAAPNYIKVEQEDEDGNDTSYYLVKPSIKNISFTVADNNTMAEDLTTGKLNLVNKVVYGPTILECLAACGVDENTVLAQLGRLDRVDNDEDLTETEEEIEEEVPEDAEAELAEEEADPDEEKPEDEEEEPTEKVRYAKATDYDLQNTPYPRIGLAFFTFSYDWPTVHEKEVRQAIAWCMDRKQLTEDYCRGFGTVVNGYYGIEQWEYLVVTNQIPYPINFLNDPEQQISEERRTKLARHANMFYTTDEEKEQMMNAWAGLNLDNLVDYNVYDVENDPERTNKIGIEKANELLDQAGWTLNRKGEPYRKGVDDVRCKMVDDELVVLDLKMMYPAGNHIVDTIQENFIDNLNECGILLTLVPEDMQNLFYSYYRETERTTDMIYLATNFHVIVDPAITYSNDTTANHEIWNNTYSDDEELYQDAVDMRKTEPGSTFEYVAKWVRFQERYNEVLPCIPLYSNYYYDFFTGMLQNYHITANVTWTQAILESYFGEPYVPEKEYGEQFLDGEGFEDDIVIDSDDDDIIIDD